MPRRPCALRQRLDHRSWFNLHQVWRRTNRRRLVACFATGCSQRFGGLCVELSWGRWRLFSSRFFGRLSPPFGAARGERNVLAAAGRLAALVILHDRPQVEIEFGGKLLSDATHFRDNRILVRRVRIDHGGSNKSSGVRIRGAVNPAAIHVCSILAAKAPLAKWRQFQVSKKSMPWTAETATCAASARARAGSASANASWSARLMAASVIGNSETSASALRRSDAAAVSPREASSMTASEANRSKLERRSSHQRRVNTSCARRTTSLLGHAVR